MVDAACPCCTPWSMRRGEGLQYIYAGGHEGLTISPSFAGTAVVWKFTAIGTRTRFYPATAFTTVSRVNDIDTDSDGNVYVAMSRAANGDHNVACIAPDGSVLWSKFVGLANGYAAGAISLCVAPNDTLYVAVRVASAAYNYNIYGLNKNTGTSIGGWPPGLGFTRTFSRMCTDTSSNLYVVHTSSTGIPRVLSIDSTGTTRWESTTQFQYRANLLYEVHINEANDELLVAAQTYSGANPRDVFLLNPTTGAINSDYDVYSTGSLVYAGDYNSDGDRFEVPLLAVVKNETTTISTAPLSDGCGCIGIRYGNRVCVASNRNITKLETDGTTVWTHDVGTIPYEKYYCVTSDVGRIGAWGVL